MQVIHVASTNPVKVNATAAAFKAAFPQQEFIVTGFNLDHGVSHQPMSDEETRRGAERRASLCRETYANADYWVGIEGGVQQDEDGLMAFAWVVVLSASGVGKGRTGAFHLPPEITRLVLAGKELGEADDIVFQRQNSKQENGAVGLLTNNLIDRRKYYEHAVLLALIPFMNPELYPREM